MVDLEEGALMLVPEIRKDYPNDASPTYVEIERSDEMVRILQILSQFSLAREPGVVTIP